MLLNMCHLFEGYPKKKCDRGIFKKIFFKNDEISLYEFMNLDPIYHNSLVHNLHFIEDLDFQENETSEVTNSIQYFENLYSNNNLDNHTTEQQKFNKNLKKKIVEIYNFNVKNLNKKSSILNPSQERLKNIRYNYFLNGAILNI